MQKWEDAIRERELKEKRRRAPGWLDREEKILEPEKTGGGEDGVDHGSDVNPSMTGGVEGMGGADMGAVGARRADSGGREDRTGGGDATGADLGAQMDRAFGSLG